MLWAIRLILPVCLFVSAAAHARSTLQPLAQLALPLAATPSGSISVSVSPNTALADNSQTMTLTAVVRDGNNQPMAQQPILINVSGAYKQVGKSQGVTNAAGTFVSTLRVGQAGPRLITATAAGITGYTSCSFVPGAPTSEQTTLIATPTRGLPASGNAAIMLTATVRDAARNPIGRLPVSLSSSNSNDVFSAANGNTLTDGTFVAFLTSREAGPRRITLVAGLATASTPASFVGADANASYTLFSVTPNAVLAADGNDAYLASVAVRDDYNNIISNYAVSVTSSGVAGKFMRTEGLTDTDGVFTTELRSGNIGTQVVAFQAGTVSGTQSVSYVVGKPSRLTSTISASPNNFVADGNASSTITAVLRDTAGNPVPNQTGLFSAIGPGNVFDDSNCITDANGRCDAVLRCTKAGTQQTRITAAGLVIGGAVQTLAGSPNQDHSSISVSPNAVVVADGGAYFSILTTLRDAYDNPVVTQPIVFLSSGPGDIFKPANGVSDNKGSFTTFLRALSIGERRIRVTAGPFTDDANVTFGVGRMAAATSRFVASPNNLVVADGNQTTQLHAVLRDAQGRVLPNQAVSLRSSGGGNAFDTSVGATDANGVFVTTMTSTRAEKKVVTLVVNFSTLMLEVNFVAGSPNQSLSSLTLVPSKVTADNVATAIVRLNVLDSFGNKVGRSPVSLASDGGNNIFANSGGNTDMFGSFRTTLKSNKAEVKTVTATLAGCTLSQNTVFAAGPPSSIKSSLTATPNSGIAADGATAATLRFTVVDAFDNLVTNQSISCTSTGTNVSFSPRIGATDGNGVFVTLLTSTSAGAKTASVRAGQMVKTVSVGFVPAVVVQAPAPAPAALLAQLLRGENDNSSEINAGTQQRAGLLAATLAQLRPHAVLSLVQLRGSPDDSVQLAVPPQLQGKDVADTYATAPGSTLLASGDVDGDSVDDILVGSSDSTTLSWYRGLGDGGLDAPQNLSLPYLPRVLGCAPLLADGSQAILSAARDVPVLSVAAAAQPTVWTQIALQQPASAMAVGDLDGDGAADLLVAHADGVQVLLGDGEQHFVSTSHALHMPGARSLSVSDFDGDGILDVASLSADGHLLAWYKGIGGGLFAVGQQQALAEAAVWLGQQHDTQALQLITASGQRRTLWLADEHFCGTPDLLP